MRDMLTAAWVHATGLLSEGGDSSTFKVAIVTTAGVVIAAAITSYAATFQRNKAPAPSPAPTAPPVEPELVRELRGRAERAEARVVELERASRDDSLEKDRLENLLWLHHVNPTTGEAVP